MKPTQHTVKTVTVEQYIRFKKLARKHDESDSPLKDIEMISEYFDQDFSDMDSGIAESFFKEWIDGMINMQPIIEAMEAGKTKPPESIKIGKTKFTVPTNIEDCKIGKYADYSKYLNAWEGETEGQYPIAMAIFCKKPKEMYSQIILNDRIETMKKVNLITAVKCCAFFFIQSDRYRRITSPWWSQREQKDTPTKATLSKV